MKRRYLIGGVAALVVVLVAGALLAGPGGQASPTPTPTPEPPIPLTAKGVVQAVRQSKLSFRALGPIAVLPKVGARVEEGQEIARLETSELDLAIAQADDAVAVAQAMLEQAEAPARPVDLAALQAAYDQAVARHNQLLAGATAPDMQAAKVAVASAETALAAARARLQQVKDGPTKAELAAAEGALAQARAGLAAAKQRQEALEPSSTPRANEVRAAELALAAAKAGLWTAQTERDGVCGTPLSPRVNCDAANARVGVAETAVAQAQAALEARQTPASETEKQAASAAVAGAAADLAAAQARLDQMRAGALAADREAAESQVSGAEAALAAAKARLEAIQPGGTPGDREASAAQVAQARAALDLRKSGPPPADVAVLKARLRQAQTALAQARASRRAAVILSPLAGTVVWTAGNVGETATPGAPVVVVADLSRLQVETTDLDESSATQLALGQPAKVTVNAFAEKVLDGTVQEIAPLATTTASGDANYTITVALAQQDPELRLGMTTKVEFGPGRPR